ncbi:hypothetical protein ONZ45_g2586 [Pleurotus djamor]|nr:hypothetical protein ONZ45_g2586 [Pleurotus djamor]
MVSTFTASVPEAQGVLARSLRFWEFTPPFPLGRLGELSVPDLFKDIPRAPEEPVTFVTNGISLKYTPFRITARDSFVPTPQSIHFAVFVPRPASPGFPLLNINGGITQLDLQYNNIQKVRDIANVPAFVKAFRDEIASETLLSPLTLSSVINGDTIHVQEPVPGQDINVPPSQVSDPSDHRQSLIHHINYLRRDFQKAWTVNKKPLKSRLAHSMLFDALAASISSSSVNALWNQPWPFRLIVAQAPSSTFPPSEELCSYEPRSGFLLQHSNLPHFIVEINSGLATQNPAEPPDFIRMLLQGASLVRLVNQHLEPFNQEKTFILVCVFVRNEGTTNWLTLFQTPTQGDRVFYTREDRSLNEFNDRATFTLRLYNLLKKIEEAEEDTEQASRLQEFKLKTESLPAFTSKPPMLKRARPPAGTPSERRSGGQGPTTEEAIASDDLGFRGFEIVPARIVAPDGIVYQTIDPLPNHLFTVFRPAFPHIRYVAKKISKDSNEIEILHFLNSLSPSCENIITLSTSFSGRSGTLWGVFPKLPYSLAQCLHYSPGYLSPHTSSVSQELIGAVAFLHDHMVAHCDLKPANLLLTGSFHLKVIDFDLALRVKDEDEEINDACGTEGWVAPEIQEKRSHSPIKSDRWACGAIILHIHDHCRQTEPSDLRLFAKQLMLDSPNQRPPLSEWLLRPRDVKQPP